MKRLFLMLPILLFIGCSSKKYFEPNEVAGYVKFDGSLPAPIIDTLRQGATLADGEFVSNDGLEKFRLPKGYRFIHKSGGYYIASKSCGDLLVIDAKSQKPFWHKKFEMRSVVAASIKGDLLAVIFSDNSLGLFDIVAKKAIYTSKQGLDIAVDTKIANPYFLDRVVIFPTLDGKLVVVDSSSTQELRTIVVGTKEHFNNIIFLQVIDEKLIAATPNKIISVTPQFTNSLDIELSDVLYVKDRVYLLTKDGQVILTDSLLNVLKSKKFNFAHFTGAIYGEYIYIIEKNGYIIALDKDLRASNVFKLSDSIESYIFTSKDKIFYDNKYFELSKI